MPERWTAALVRRLRRPAVEGNKETNMDVARQTNDEQATLWNGVAGRAWVEAQEVTDQLYKPLEDLLVDPIVAGSVGLVLDVGCGTGSTTIAAARKVGPQGRAVGIDVSEPMIAAARARADRDGVPAQFISANAQVHVFESARVDLIISRFGVMFFDDFVQAFTNLRSAARDDAELRFVAWRSAAENPFMTTAERAAAPLLPNLPARRPGAPGQFAFADQHRVSGVLAASGWGGIDIQPIDVTCTMPEKELLRHLSRFGPLGQALHQVDDRTRTHVIETVRPAFDPYVHGADVRFTAACWKVVARARPAIAGS
jgi:SAM-dependent methyltransferase